MQDIIGKYKAVTNDSFMVTENRYIDVLKGDEISVVAVNYLIKSIKIEFKSGETGWFSYQYLKNFIKSEYCEEEIQVEDFIPEK